METIEMNFSVMINGFPGNMGKIVYNSLRKRDIDVIPYSLTGKEIIEDHFAYNGIKIELIKPEERDKKIIDVISKYKNFLSVDYTHPTAVNGNAEFYIKNKLPFVMGTTGGDREKLLKDVKEAKLYAVISPNMAKQIVALQVALEYMASNFPGLYQNYNLSVVESHQNTKADTSGTAKAFVEIFKKMDIDTYNVSDIEKIRIKSEQMTRMKVPKENLDGHAFHTYELVSEDKTVNFRFDHNVCGRSIYAEGTVDAVLFLKKQIVNNNPKHLFNMMDILKDGAMN